MALTIEWSTDAQESLNELYDFLEENWPDQVVRDFTKKLNNKLELISQNPTLYKSSVRLEETRECIVTKHNTIFYKHSKDDGKVYIVSFWANYKDPTSISVKKIGLHI